MKKSIYLIILLFSVSFLTACNDASTTPQTITNRATIGSPTASVKIEEFSDFQCPACAQITPQLEEVVTRNSDIAQLSYHYFPLPYHQFGFKAAEAGECANDQGKFWEFAKMAFENQDNLSDDNLKSFASTLKLNTDTFNKCLDSGKKKDMIQSDMADGNNRQLAYTPSIYVNGTLVQWSNSNDFEAYIKSLAK
jgi:protein-disulfide isomerase